MSLPVHLAPVVGGMVATMRPLAWADRLPFLMWRRSRYTEFVQCFGGADGLAGYPTFGCLLEHVMEALGWPLIDCLEAAAIYSLVDDQHLKLAAWQWASRTGFVEALHDFTSAPELFMAQRQAETAPRLVTTIH